MYYKWLQQIFCLLIKTWGGHGARQEVNFPLNILPLKKKDFVEDQLYTVNILNWIFRFLQRSLTDVTVHSRHITPICHIIPTMCSCHIGQVWDIVVTTCNWHITPIWHVIHTTCIWHIIPLWHIILTICCWILVKSILGYKYLKCQIYK
jgi:hypothetical protein